MMIPRLLSPSRAWCIGLLLMLGIAAVTIAPSAAPAKEQPKLPDEFAFLPQEATCYLHVRVADLWNSDIARQMRVALLGEYLRVESDFKNRLGVQPGDVETLTVASMRTPELLDIFGANLGHHLEVPGVRSESGGGGSKAEEKKGGDASDKPPIKELPPPVAKSPARGGKEKLQPADVASLLDRTPVLIATVARPETLNQVRDLAAKTGKKHQLQGKTYFTGDGDVAVFFINDRSYVRGPAPLIVKGIEALGKVQATPRLEALDKHSTAQIWLDSTRFGEKNRSPDGDFGHFPGGRALAPLMKSKGKTVAVNLGKQATGHVEVHFATEAQAKGAVEALEDYLTLFRLFGVGEMLTLLQRTVDDADDARQEEAAATCMLYFERLAKSIRKAAVKQSGTTLTVDITADTDMAVIAQEAKAYLKEIQSDPQAILARNYNKSRNNLKQIVLALHNYHDAYKRFPAWATCDAKDKPLLSWRVAILPFIEQGPLYQQFKLDEPWDSPHNIKLLAQMPKVYAVPGVKTKEPGMTYYQGFVGTGAGWEPARPGGNYNKFGIRIVEITDGTSNTIAVIEAGEPVPWTKPVDLPFEMGKPLPKFAGPFKTKANAAFFDGSVRTIPAKLEPMIMSALVTRAGGEVVPFDDWK
jgi:prepilin-type processing-associated H-X9-DG protein